MTPRVVTDGKHLALEGTPFRIHGVTYGSFLPRVDGERFPTRPQVKHDFQMMAESGLNTVRTYELPPVDVLEAAEDFGLRILIGLQYHDWRMEASPNHRARVRILDAGRREVDRALERCASLPHVIGIAVGNEVPADIVRVHGIGSVEDTLSELVRRVQVGSDNLLATYVNYPTTEYLGVDGQDFVCFNVFLDDPHALRRYLRHLHVVSRSRPLVITEIGLASEIHGEAGQAHALADQLRVVDETGCAGATVFAWTDEWGFGGEPVDGWGFGITAANRCPKLALKVLRNWAHKSTIDLRPSWPRASVIVCAYNEEATIGQCLSSLEACRYPNFEVIVCDDGSTDRTLEIARPFRFRILELAHGGLSRARNAGLAEAIGDFVAYLDADAACHSDWLFHLALSLEDGGVVATGGPNFGFAEAGFVERAVTLSPGTPAEVLLTDDRAEHVPGCNMAYDKRALEAVNGFDAAYTAAGDDVDVCWKLLDRGHEIAFAPAAQVSHHRRGSVRRYLGQQRGYGQAERMLAGAHPHRFNRFGQARWRGFIYGGVAVLPSIFRPVVYHGYAGSAPFQPIARRRAELANASIGAVLPFAAPLALFGLVLGTVSSWWWLLAAAMILLGVAAYGLSVAAATRPPRSEPRPMALRALVGVLHVLQPFARAWGRIRGMPLPLAHRTRPTWTGDRIGWLRSLEDDLRRRNCDVRLGSPSDKWDLRVRASAVAEARVTTAISWGWFPQMSANVRPTVWSWFAIATAVAFALVNRGWFWSAPIVVGAVVTCEVRRLTHRVHRAIELTTSADHS
jgi:glycosyltransferase involved in cell wall biosynthesis